MIHAKGPSMQTRSLAAMALCSTLLASCGGGGGDAGSQPPTITSSTVGTARYSDALLITLLGSNLDQTLTFNTTGCRNFTRLTTAPTASTATVAYYNCTVSGVGDQTIAVNGGGITLRTLNFNAPVPQVTLLITNGVAVSGSLVITLSPTAAPITVDNFLAYVKSGFYNNTVFHRNARTGTGGSFVVQGGGYTAPVNSAQPLPTPKPTNPPIVLERGLSNVRYTVAMARLSSPNTATSEFFINTANNLFLNGDGTAANPGYATFGTVTTGTALVDAMDTAPCVANYYGVGNPDCLPEPNLVIASAQQTR